MIMTEIPLEIRLQGHLHVFVTGPETICQWVDENTLDVPGAEFTQLYKQHKWDGKWSPATWCRSIGGGVHELRCSRGILPRLLQDLGYAHKLVRHTDISSDIAQYIGHQPKWQALRDYQQNAFMEALEHGWGRIAFATNAGKGAVIAMLAEFAVLHDVNALILCDEKAVYEALEGELWTWAKIRPHLLKAGASELPEDGVTLAMVPTLARRIKEDSETWREWLKGQGMLLLDEADKATAPTWRDICRSSTKTQWRVGFSGTFPQSRSYADWQLEEIMGPVLLRASNKELVERGISAKPTVELYGFDATPGREQLLRMKDWYELAAPARRLWIYDLTIVLNPLRHEYVRSLVRPNVPTAIVVNRVEHGHQLCDAFQGAAYFLDGSASDTERSRMLDDFREGGFSILIVTKIFDRGTNRLGWAQDVIFASAEGSDRQTLQRIGRGLRRADGKAFLRLVDIIDHVKLHPEEEDKRLIKAADFLHTAGRKRVELYTAEGFEVKIHA